MKQLRCLLLAALSACICTSVLAGTVTVVGTTAGGPIWNRPVAGNPPTGLSGVGTAVPYEVEEFQVDASGTYTFQETATTANFDNYTFLYQDSFNAAAPLVNVLIGNDDNPTIGLSGFSFILTQNVDYFFVTTGFDNADFGAFGKTISGPGDIQIGPPVAVPEPATLALLGLGLAGLGFSRRKQ